MAGTWGSNDRMLPASCSAFSGPPAYGRTAPPEGAGPSHTNHQSRQSLTDMAISPLDQVSFSTEGTSLPVLSIVNLPIKGTQTLSYDGSFQMGSHRLIVHFAPGSQASRHHSGVTVPSPAEAASVEVSLSGDIITTSWVVHGGVGELADGCMAICPHLGDWTA